MDGPALFDFSVYLAEIDPSQSYEITHLAGGFVNFTVRATKVQGRGSTSVNAADSGPFKGHESLILKYAPPFMARVGKDAPFSQYRQVKCFVYFNSVPFDLKRHRSSRHEL
jgi:hypothetical protein